MYKSNKFNKLYNLYASIVSGKIGNTYKVSFDSGIEEFKNFALSCKAEGKQLGLQLDGEVNAWNKLLYYISPDMDAKKLFAGFVAESFANNGILNPLCFTSEEGEIYFHYMDVSPSSHGENISVGEENFLGPRCPAPLYEIVVQFSMHFDLSIAVNECDSNEFRFIVRERNERFYNKYSPTHNPIIAELYSRMQDKISILSLDSYLSQRYSNYVHALIPTVYPGIPPKATRKWREERLSSNIHIPHLSGAPEWMLDIMRRDIFRLEQYNLQGQCGAEVGDVVIDAGAFVGESGIYFADKVGKTGKVYSFEPDPVNYAAMLQNFQSNNITDNVYGVRIALSDTTKTIEFVRRRGAASGKSENEESSIDLEKIYVRGITLDEFAASEKLEHIDFLKADLEGADIDFLKGATETIKKFAPKCGLTVYHKEDDIVEIPKLLLSCQPNYKFWFRMESEPVLFAKV